VSDFDDYRESYELRNLLGKNPATIRSRDLWPIDIEALYADIARRAAEPLPDGSESPFSANDPLAAQNILFGHVAQMLAIYGYELNLRNYQTWVNLLAWFGIELKPAEYGAVRLRFYRDRNQRLRGLPATVPLGYRVRSTRNKNRHAITIESKTVADPDVEYVDVAARLDVLGKNFARNVVRGEYSRPYRPLDGIDRVENVALIYEGREKETLANACLRARKEFQKGDRLVTLSDYRTTAIAEGAKKVLVLPGVQKNTAGYFGHAVSVFVWPGGLAELMQPIFDGKRKKVVGTVVAVEAADVISLNGKISCKAAVGSDLRALEARAREAIASKFNPPYGSWGAKDPYATIATIVEKVDGIYAVPRMNLREMGTAGATAENGGRRTLSRIVAEGVAPWTLFQVEPSTVFEFV